MMRSFPVIGLAHRLGLLAVAAASLLPVAAHAADGANSAENSTKTASAQPAGQVQAWPIHLQHMKPTDFLKFFLEQKTSPFLLPTSAQSITPDDIHGTVIVQGDESSALKVMEIARLLDVVPKQVKLVVRFTHAPDADHPNSFVQPVLAVAIAEVKNNEPVDISVFADHHLLQAHITPHINGDNSVSLACALTSQATGSVARAEDEATRLWASQSAFIYAGPTWYHRTTGLLPSDLLENGGKAADPAKAKTVSYAESIDGTSNLSLPPKGEYAVSVAPILVPAAK